ncbi:MAG: hypothetical protein NPIRA02_09610 [Nitrospirales bacterium]|nr:MAG: hypothetical protein NPIRA02_09610 [Nitrospirales bacterium]
MLEPTAYSTVHFIAYFLSRLSFDSLPDFVPAAEYVAERVPQGAPFVVKAKGLKTIDAQARLIG